MDIRKLLGISPKRKPGMAQAGNYAAPVDTIDDPAMRRTLGVADPASAVRTGEVRSHDAALDSLAKKAGRLRQPYRSPR